MRRSVGEMKRNVGDERKWEGGVMKVGGRGVVGD